MFGLIALIVCVVLAFKAARDYGRNPFLWAFITFCVGLGTQLMLSLVSGVVIGLVLLLMGYSAGQIPVVIDGLSLFISIGLTILSIGAMLFVIKMISSVPDGVEVPRAKKAGSLGLND